MELYISELDLCFLSRVKTLNRLLLVNKLNDDLTKYWISDALRGEDERLDNLDE